MSDRCNKRKGRLLGMYYEDLRMRGMPVSTGTSVKYAPLAAAELHGMLHEFRAKKRRRLWAQFADLYLWPNCMGGYKADTRPYLRLLADGKLIESKLQREEWENASRTAVSDG